MRFSTHFRSGGSTFVQLPTREKAFCSPLPSLSLGYRIDGTYQKRLYGFLPRKKLPKRCCKQHITCVKRTYHEHEVFISRAAGAYHASAGCLTSIPIPRKIRHMSNRIFSSTPRSRCAHVQFAGFVLCVCGSADITAAALQFGAQLFLR